MDYKKSGVDIEAGYKSVELMKEAVKSTMREEVLGGIGGFSGAFSLAKIKEMEEPVLLSGTDGCGTKVKLAFIMDKHDTIGIDAVAMCVNDVVCAGGEPLFFLDYIACGKNYPEKIATIVGGVAEGCRQSECALIGGETAEHPGLMPQDEYDLAGFAVGVVDEDKIIDGSKVKVGDAIIGIASSGPHSNGYSLIRRILKLANAKPLEDKLSDGTVLADALLAPTRIYVKQILKLIKEVDVHALAHITGGGFWENIPRVLPEGTCAACDGDSWTRPEVFKYLQKNGNVDAYEMFRTFNCGVGMIAVVTKEEAQKACDVLNALGEKAWVLGEIAPVGADGKQVTIKIYENF